MTRAKGSAKAGDARRTHDRDEDRGGHHEDRVGEAVLDGAVGSTSAQLDHPVGVRSAVCTCVRQWGLLRACPRVMCTNSSAEQVRGLVATPAGGTEAGQ